MIFSVLIIINCFSVISYKFCISHLEMFKIHDHSKTIIPWLYSVIKPTKNIKPTKHITSLYQLSVNFSNMRNYLKIT
jgi:hypothetical protein